MKNGGTWKSRHGRISVRVSASRIGTDWCIVVTGGDRPHIGAVGWTQEVSQPVSLNFPGHRDQAVADLFLRTLAPIAGRHVVLAGIHVDNITPAEIGKVLELCGGLAQRVLADLSKGSV